MTRREVEIVYVPAGVTAEIFGRAPEMKRVWPPQVPPDFVPLRGAGCCRDCGMDDGPLYEGNLCRWCWQLSKFPPPPIQQKLRDAAAATDPEIQVALVVGIVIWLVLLANILTGS